jgi:hypothetical protein
LAAILLSACAASVTTATPTPAPTPATTSTPTPIPSEPAPQLLNPTQTVELNYGEHKSVTYQQIQDEITQMFNRDIKLSKQDGYEYQLRKITIENKNINVFLELHFQPISKAWLIKDAYSWLGLAAFSGFDIDGKFAGSIYNTGYDISVIVSTPLADGNVISWGTSKIKDSGKPFDNNTFTRDRIWIDGPGMKILN